MNRLYLVGLLTVGCAKQTPTTATNSHGPLCSERTLPVGFSNERHLLGWGSAPSPAAADDVARAEIAKIFSVTIEQTFQSSQSARMERDGSGSSTALSANQRSDTKSTTQATLAGIEIAKQWKSGSGHCSVAALDRDQAAQPLLQTLANTEATMAQHRLRSKTAPDPLTAIHHINTALRRAPDRDAIIATLLILDRKPPDSPSPTAAELNLDKSALLAGTVIRFQSKGVPAAVATSVNAALTAVGFTVGASGPLGVLASISVAPNGPDDYGFHHAAATLTVRFTNQQGGVVSEFRLTERASSQSKPRAREQAIDQLNGQLSAAENPFHRHALDLLNRTIDS